MQEKADRQSAKVSARDSYLLTAVRSESDNKQVDLSITSLISNMYNMPRPTDFGTGRLVT